MDDIFDSLIYIIITIVAFVISALGKKKKKNNRPNIPPVQRATEPQPEKKRTIFPDIEQLIKEEMGLELTDNKFVEDSIVNQYEEKEVVNEQPLDSVPPEMLDDKPDVPYSIEYEEMDLTKEGSILDSEISNEIVEEENELQDFDLREAVIYSEIINRKEY